MLLRRALAGLTLLALAACGPEFEQAPQDTSLRTTGSELASITAVYDATLRAPKCGTVSSSCGTGTLVNGRGAVGPEANAPNTINSSCADGDSGTYQVDESLESLRVFTADGSNLATGKTVTIEAEVWAYSGGEVDSLDLYSAPNANSPVWTRIATVTPSGGGLQVLSASFILPAGSLQAIRGVYRYSGSASPCSTGGWDDRDDLVFAVGPSSDTTKPTVSLTAPATGATLQGTVTVSASASDTVGVTKVEFYSGTTRIGTDTTAPYSISWNTTGVANGTYSLSARAYDLSGNEGVSAARSVTVSNPVACSTSQQLLLNGGFEGGGANWSASTGVIASNATTARSGSWRALLGGKGTSNTTTLSQQVSIPTGSCPVTLKFWLKITTSEPAGSFPLDNLDLQILNTSGVPVATLGRYSNLDASASYVERTIDMSAYKGQTLRIAFVAHEDAFNRTSFFVDDTSLNVFR
jgi:hypothetical protein